MGRGNPEQIEQHFDRQKPGGEKYGGAYRRANKKNKIRVERRKGKRFKEEISEDHTEIVPEDPTYNKYHGWEY